MKFTDELLDKAVAFINEKYKIEGGHFELAREKYHQETIECFKEYFFKDEPICCSLELTWNDIMPGILLPLIQQNISLIAVDDTTGEIMGIRITAETNQEYDMSEMTACGDGKMTELYDFLDYAKKQSDFYNKYGVTKAYEFVALAVNKKYRQRGIATKLMSATIDMLRFCKPEIQYIKSLGSSKFSQAIFEKVGFENIYECYYKDYIVDGKVLLNNTGVHKKLVQYVIKI